MEYCILFFADVNKSYEILFALLEAKLDMASQNENCIYKIWFNFDTSNAPEHLILCLLKLFSLLLIFCCHGALKWEELLARPRKVDFNIPGVRQITDNKLVTKM